MERNEQQNIIKLKIEGPLAEEGNVPISLLAEKLQALQESLYGAANAMEGFSGGAKGQWINQITDSCKLLFSNFIKGSLIAETKLPEIQEIPLSEELNLQKRAVSTFKNALAAINKKDIKELQKLMPNSPTRVRFVKKCEKLFPDTDSYSIAIGNGSGKTFATLKSENRDSLKMFEDIEEQSLTTTRKTLRGIFIEIRIGDDKRHFAIKGKDREHKFQYEEELEDFISQIPTRSQVEVVCDVELNNDGSIKNESRVYDVRIIDMQPPIFNKFDFDNRSFVLKKPVEAIFKYEDGLWVYEIPEYGIHTYSYDRKEAFASIGEDFAFQYDDIALEEDENLSEDAIKLKQRIKENLKEVIQEN